MFHLQSARRNNPVLVICLVLLMGVLASGCQNTGGYGNPASNPTTQPGTGGY